MERYTVATPNQSVSHSFENRAGHRRATPLNPVWAGTAVRHSSCNRTKHAPRTNETRALHSHCAFHGSTMCLHPLGVKDMINHIPTSCRSSPLHGVRRKDTCALDSLTTDKVHTSSRRDLQSVRAQSPPPLGGVPEGSSKCR